MDPRVPREARPRPWGRSRIVPERQPDRGPGFPGVPNVPWGRQTRQFQGIGLDSEASVEARGISGPVPRVVPSLLPLPMPRLEATRHGREGEGMRMIPAWKTAWEEWGLPRRIHAIVATLVWGFVAAVLFALGHGWVALWFVFLALLHWTDFFSFVRRLLPGGRR